MKLIGSIVLVIVASLSSGCASIVGSDTTIVNVLTSDGESTGVSIDGMKSEVPGVVMLRNDGNDKIIVADDDRCAKSTVVRRKVTPEFFGNLITGGPLGSSTDFATGKMWTYNDTVLIQCG